MVDALRTAPPASIGTPCFVRCGVVVPQITTVTVASVLTRLARTGADLLRRTATQAWLTANPGSVIASLTFGDSASALFALWTEPGHGEPREPVLTLREFLVVGTTGSVEGADITLPAGDDVDDDVSFEAAVRIALDTGWSSWSSGEVHA
ncbi:MAG: hypothetical protein GEV10_14875 [Streptosporangiales bacterium]|nr:hypothetical protein [Streptosporangiales bacterium]